MTGLRRTLAPAALALAVFAASAHAQSSELRKLFDEGLSQMRQGNEAQALATFQRALALDPSSDEAYELYRATEQEVWLQMLVREGQFEIIAKRFIDLADLGRMDVENDRDAIRELLTQLKEGPAPVERRKIVAALRARHGEYAVPYMIGALAERGDDDYRVIVMVSLAELGSAAVPPLIEALESTDSFQARNIALVLGNIGDARAAGSLAWVASDPTRDDEVRRAAGMALEKVGGGAEGGAASALVGEGLAYLNGRDEVLASYLLSRVIWNWGGGALEPAAVPHDMYAPEMAKKCFQRALSADPSNLDARAGLVRSTMSEKIELIHRMMVEDDQWMDLALAVEEGMLTAYAAGPQAMERALESATKDGDIGAATTLLRYYGDASAAPTPAMLAALGSAVPQIREEAAIAVANSAIAGGRLALDPRVVEHLSTAAGRAIQRTALVIDPDARRNAALVSALEARGIATASADRGTLGLATLRRAGGFDVIVCADVLPDITTQQVLTDVRNDARLAATPFVVVASDAEAADELYSDRAQAIVAGADGTDAIVDSLEERVNIDRMEADDLSQRSAQALADLARCNVDVTAAESSLASTLEFRPDSVTIPAMSALGRAGSSASVEGLLGVVTDGDRSDEARIAAGHALASVLRRTGGMSEDAYASLSGLITDGDVNLLVRHAAAEALGALRLGDSQRAAALRAVEVQVTE
ncbi:MAG: HEAT repeat domain-containing protein [Planctomycetota bacterium]